MSRQRLEKRRSAGHLLDALDIVDFRLGDPRRFRLGIHIGQGQTHDGVDGTGTMDGRQKGFDVDTMAQGPGGPDAFGGGNRSEDGAVHVEEEGTIRGIEDGCLSWQKVLPVSRV